MKRSGSSPATARANALVLRRLATRIAKRAPGQSVGALLAGGDAAERLGLAVRLAAAGGDELYRVDLGAVAGRYIGETEKNLARIFDLADGSGAILLFDEADALFGKRTEVRDSHDRYANIEVSYLLHRIERFDGVVLLAANRRAVLKQAFLRRLDSVVDLDC